MTRRGVAGFWAALVGVVSCGPDGPPPGAQPGTRPAPVRTNRPLYALTHLAPVVEVDITAAYTNAGVDTVYVVSCGGAGPAYHLERWTEAGWRSAFTPACAAVFTPPTAVPPGGVLSASTPVAAYEDSSGVPRFAYAPIGGWYRIVLRVASYWDRRAGVHGVGPLLPLEDRVSNPFLLTD